MNYVRALAFAAIGFASFAPASFAQTADAESTWEKIQRDKKIMIACITDPPYAAYDPTTNNWEGFQIDMAKGLAESLGVEWECVNSSWSNLALDIQSGKVDLAFSVQATPARAAVINFVGPMYDQGFALVVKNEPGVSTNWQDYNAADKRISVVLGSVNDNVVDMLFPKASKVVLPSGGEPQMAVASNRADAYLASVITGPFAQLKNPNLQSVVIPASAMSFPAYIGVRYETDQRYAQYLRWWAEWNRLQGLTEKIAKESMVKAGVPADAIPADWTLR